MSNHDRNEGFHILDDLIFEPTHAPAVQKPNSPRQAHNEGVRVVEEMVIDFQQASEKGVRILEQMVIDLKDTPQIKDALEETESPAKKIGSPRAEVSGVCHPLEKLESPPNKFEKPHSKKP